MAGGTGRHGRLAYFRVRTVLVDLVSSAISSASSTFFLSRTVPVAASTTSTTLASSLAVSSLPDCSASCHGAAELGGGGVLVAELAGLQALLDDLGQLGLAGVVRDLPVDPGGQGLVVGPHGPDQALAEHLGGAVGRGGDQADPGGEHLLADAAGADLHADVVVAALAAPQAPVG